jgi:hypothetical protein
LRAFDLADVSWPFFCWFEEGRKSDRGEDADDQDDDQELDEREALLLLGALAQLGEHWGCPSLTGCWWCGLHSPDP